MAKNKARSFKGFPPDKRKMAEQQDDEIIKKIEGGEKILLPGQGGTELDEPLVKYEPTEVEIVLPRKATHWGRHRIAFGRDRHTREALSGYGGRGCTAAGSIDIVVGSGGPEPTHGEVVGPNFFTDAARIYLTQRGDIDRYFSLPPDIPNAILPDENRSAIGIKADGIRIIGREGVRIYTNARTKTSEQEPETTAVGGDVQSRNGIHLIACMDVGPVEITPPERALSGDNTDYKKLQPLVRGQFLVGYLKELTTSIQDFQNAMTKFMVHQINFNTAIAAHTHVVTPSGEGIVAIPDFKNLLPNVLATNLGELQEVIKTISSETNIKIIDNVNWLEPGAKKSILSPYNKTN